MNVMYELQCDPLNENEPNIQRRDRPYQGWVSCGFHPSKHTEFHPMSYKRKRGTGDTPEPLSKKKRVSNPTTSMLQSIACAADLDTSEEKEEIDDTVACFDWSLAKRYEERVTSLDSALAWLRRKCRSARKHPHLLAIVDGFAAWLDLPPLSPVVKGVKSAFLHKHRDVYHLVQWCKPVAWHFGEGSRRQYRNKLDFLPDWQLLLVLVLRVPGYGDCCVLHGSWIGRARSCGATCWMLRTGRKRTTTLG
jgi:hypothetical protein